MIDAKVVNDEVNMRLKGTPIDLLTEIQLLNLNALEAVAEYSNADVKQLVKEMARILIETIEERGD
ncbi:MULTISPECIES: hypothetical protein [Clostridia]|uniref:hypothetical protein n=1 Tax=Clostridia TaxID=186801 RepID=UPI002A8FE87B|nr:hypothetical protein [Peptostreptococcus porci]MDY5098716.1 hypothetical protein [Clostridium sp.]MDY5437492.1 hypothetical protein [Peptostreptococcus porci]